MFSIETLAQIYNQYFSIDNSNITAHEEFAIIMESIGRDDDAVNHFRECGVISLKKKRHEDAVKFFRRGFDVDKSRCDLWYWLGKTYQDLNDLENTVKYFKESSFCDGKEAKSANAAGIAELYQLIKDNARIQNKEDLIEKLVKRANEINRT